MELRVGVHGLSGISKRGLLRERESGFPVLVHCRKVYCADDIGTGVYLVVRKRDCWLAKRRRARTAKRSWIRCLIDKAVCAGYPLVVADEFDAMWHAIVVDFR